VISIDEEGPYRSITRKLLDVLYIHAVLLQSDISVSVASFKLLWPLYSVIHLNTYARKKFFLTLLGILTTCLNTDSKAELSVEINNRLTQIYSFIWNCASEQIKELFAKRKAIVSAISSLYEEDDSGLIQVALYLFQIYANIQRQFQCPHSFFNDQFICPVVQEIMKEIHPHKIFARIVHLIHCDHTVLLDFLISNETQFLEYFLIYLHFLEKNWSSSREFFSKATEEQDTTKHSTMTTSNKTTDEVIPTIIRLKYALVKLTEKNLFPFKVTPLVKCLCTIEDLSESSFSNIIDDYGNIEDI